MSFKSDIIRVLCAHYDYKCAEIVARDVNFAVIHIPDQIGDAMAVFPIIRALEAQKVGHILIVASLMNKSVFEALELADGKLTVVSMRFQDKATLKEIKALAAGIRKEHGTPDLCIEAMRKRNYKTLCFIGHLKAKANLQAVGLTMRCFSPVSKIASRMDQAFRAPVPMTWSILMREAGFPAVRAIYELPLCEKVLAEVRQQTGRFEKYIAFNFEGSIKARTFSLPVAKQLIAALREKTRLPVMVVHSPKMAAEAAELTNACENVHRLALEPSIMRSAAVIRDAWFAITPDTSILHMASAYNTPAIAVYTNYKTRWPAMQDIAENIVVGRDIDHISMAEFSSVLARMMERMGEPTCVK